MKLNIGTDDLIDLFLSVLPKGYFVVEKRRADENDINTTTLIFHNRIINSKVLIRFENDNIKVICKDSDLKEMIESAYIDFVCMQQENIDKPEEEYLKIKQEFLKNIARTSAPEKELNDSLKRGFETEKFYAVRCANHVSLLLQANPYYSKDRDIKIGDVFMADLNPVVEEEFGGIRSVVVIGYDQDKLNYVCVPLTTSDRLGIYKTGLISAEGKTLYAVTDKLKIISSIRLYQKQGSLPEEKLKEMKALVQSSYAFFSDIKIDYDYDSKIDYKDVIKTMGNLAQAVNYFPISAQTEATIMDVIEKYSKYIVQQGIRITRKNGKIDYLCEYYGRKTAITLNPNSRNTRDRYFPIEYQFSQFDVKTKKSYDRNARFDREFTLFYRKYMLEKEQYYYLHLLKHICEVENYFFRKENIVDIEKIYEYTEIRGKAIRRELNELGFDYTGSYADIITKGAEGFNLSKLKFIDRDYDEPESE